MGRVTKTPGQGRNNREDEEEASLRLWLVKRDFSVSVTRALVFGPGMEHSSSSQWKSEGSYWYPRLALVWYSHQHGIYRKDKLFDFQQMSDKCYFLYQTLNSNFIPVLFRLT